MTLQDFLSPLIDVLKIAGGVVLGLFAMDLAHSSIDEEDE